MTSITAAGALLLVAASIGKVVRPRPTTVALRDFGMPARDSWVRIGALCEAGAGVAALFVDGRWPPLLVAGSYAGFAGFVGLALAKGMPISSCGCFGEADSPPTPVHLVIVVTFAAGAAWHCSARYPRSVAGTLVTSPGRGVALFLMVAALSYGAYLVMTDLPRLRAARSPLRNPRQQGEVGRS